ncbi:MAG TPA: hypothetical protein VM597_19830 [Gemmataceae bacterium]|jgi:hypothetical protein|nr:hypothetical protein [Gemmataceae bacterium]
MPRRDYDHADERDDYRDGPPRKGPNVVVWVVVGVVLVAVLAAGLAGCIGYAFVARTAGRPAVAPPAPPAPTVAPAGPMKRVYNRDELRTAVMAKTMEEVKALLGAPLRSWESDGDPVWTYEGISRDPASGTNDRIVNVFFADGKVVKIGF